MDNSINRGAGILCHISSLPGKYGIGSLGEEAYAFADFLKKCGIKFWQILPLVQTGFGDSPYQSVCCNSGNPYFIDLETLKNDGLLTDKELSDCVMPEGETDYSALYESRYAVLRLAFSRFDHCCTEFVNFLSEGVFEDYALFMSLKSAFNCSFDSFPEEFKRRDKKALAEFKKSVYDTEYCFWQFLQYEFSKQWQKLKSYVNSLGIKIIGDVPLYVAYDSSDVWGRPEIFKLDKNLKPTHVAGVPPDYFSANGQLWGNPLYDWEALEAEGYAWWINRVRHAAELYDVIRIDHFRGLDRYYSVSAEANTAAAGEWIPGPGIKLFESIKAALGDVCFIAEDLGVLDDGVIALREKTGFAGMKVLQFAFDGNSMNPYLPANTEENSVVYTGTHDNSTTLGFLNAMNGIQFKTFKKRLSAALTDERAECNFITRKQTARAVSVCAFASPAWLAVIPVQDLLLLDNSARMNTPSMPQGNWRFRLKEIPNRRYAELTAKLTKRFYRF